MNPPTPSDAYKSSWLVLARKTARKFRAETTGSAEASHYVYVVLLKGMTTPEGAEGVYVGPSCRPPVERFRQHKANHRASRHVRKYGERLLPKLYKHLNPLSREEALEVEGRLAKALQDAGVPNVMGGH